MNRRILSRSRWSIAILPATLVALTAACSSGGGGGGGGGGATTTESEPNDTPAMATALAVGTAGVGSLTTEADVDYWQLTVPDNTVLSIELFGTRRDQAAWDANGTIPRITVLDADGTTVLLNHDYTNLWSWGEHDLDHPMLYAGQGGTFYLCVAVEPGGVVLDADYAVRVNRISLSGIQLEAESFGPGPASNDTSGTAEPINPGPVFGYHMDDEDDYFSFQVTSPSIVRFEVVAYRNGVFEEDDDYFDPYLYLYDTDGTTELASNDDSFFYDPAIQYFIDTPGTYYVDVHEWSGSAGDAPYFMSFSRSPAGGSVENEPNDDPATADPIAYGGAISGSIDTGEADGFRFNATKGDMVRVQMFDASNSQSKADFAFVEIYAPDGITTLPLGGDYNLRTVTTIIQETGPHYAVVFPDGGLTDYRIELTRFKSSTYETESNDTIATADALPGSGLASGVIQAPAPGVADVDLFRFTVSESRLTTISIYASADATNSDGYYQFSHHGSSLEPNLRILDSDGVEVASSTSDYSSDSTESVTNALPCAAVTMTGQAAGTYYVEVSDAFGGDGPDYYYVIERTN